VQPHEPYDVAPEEFYRDLVPGYDGLLDGTINNIRRHVKSKREASPEDLQHLLALYEGNLRYADSVLGDLIEILRESELLESSILVVTSDHGESLGERGRFGHGNNIHRETTAIPLLIRLPSRYAATGRVSVPFGTVDIMPTVLDFADVSAPPGRWGRSLLPQLGDLKPADWPRPLPSWAGGSTAASVAVFGADCKYTFDSRNGRESLFTFEEQEDGEDIRSRRPVTFDYLAFTSLTAGTPLSADTSAPETEELDAEALEALRALGYVE
jgi:arylsulfatase A-like enzyme